MTNARRQSSWMVTLSLAAIAAAYMVFVWSPDRRAIRELREQFEMQRAFIAQSAEISHALIATQKQLAEVQAVATAWKKTAPGTREISSLYSRIDGLAKAADLTIARFDPQPFVVLEKLRQIPIMINCTGDFADIHRFLRGVEQMATTVWVDSMRLEKATNQGKSAQCEVRLVIFSSNPDISGYARHTD